MGENVNVPQKNKLRMAIGGAAAAAIVGIVGYGASQMDSNPQQQEQQIIYQGPLGPAAGESAPLWQELTPEKIQELAQIPGVNQIGEKYVSTVSPDLQAKANAAGYKLIWQGDPNDTTGRTVIAEGRQVSAGREDWTIEDNGFGRAGNKIRGIVKTVGPDPTDPTQQKGFYLTLEDPIKKQDFTIAIGLAPFNDWPNLGYTSFVVDDLNIGPAQIKPVEDKAKQTVSSVRIAPSLQDSSTMVLKQDKDFLTFYGLFRKEGLKPSDVFREGDYVSIFMQVTGDDPKTHDYIIAKDSAGVQKAQLVAIRRFNGEPQWRSEIRPDGAVNYGNGVIGPTPQDVQKANSGK